jgi:hypothetical protein
MGEWVGELLHNFLFQLCIKLFLFFEILCSEKKLDLQAEALPPRPEQPLNFPDPRSFVQDMQPASSKANYFTKCFYESVN